MWNAARPRAVASSDVSDGQASMRQPPPIRGSELAIDAGCNSLTAFEPGHDIGSHRSDDKRAPR